MILMILSLEEPKSAQIDDANKREREGNDDTETVETKEGDASAAPQEGEQGTSAGKIIKRAAKSIGECVSNAYYDQHSSPESSLRNSSSFDNIVMAKISGTVDAADTMLLLRHKSTERSQQRTRTTRRFY